LDSFHGLAAPSEHILSALFLHDNNTRKIITVGYVLLKSQQLINQSTHGSIKFNSGCSVDMKRWKRDTHMHTYPVTRCRPSYRTEYPSVSHKQPLPAPSWNITHTPHTMSENSSQSYRASPAIWDHTVFPATRLR